MKLKKYKSQKNDDLSRKLKSYAALTGAFLLNAGAAQSQVIFTDVDPDTLILKTTFDIDFDHDGISEISIIQSTLYGIEQWAILNPGANPARVMSVFTSFGFVPLYYPLNLPAGNPIGPGGAFNTLGTGAGKLGHFVVTSQFSRIGGFFRDSTGYIGVEFNINGSPHYGWIECSIDSTVDSVMVTGYAYESTPNTLILAGAGNTSGIPEHQSTISPALSFYPNPVRNGKTFIQIEAKQSAELRLEIINGMGQVLQSETRSLNSGKNIIELDVKSLAAGTYFVKLTEGEKAFFRKILISK